MWYLLWKNPNFYTYIFEIIFLWLFNSLEHPLKKWNFLQQSFNLYYYIIIPYNLYINKNI